jgi:hypothetical protein
MARIEPLIREETRDKFNLSYLSFKKTVASDEENIKNISVLLSGGTCASFCSESLIAIDYLKIAMQSF